MPVLAGRECQALERLLLLLRLDHCLCNRIVHVIKQVLFGQADENWYFGYDRSDFFLPLIDMLKGYGLVDCHADNEDVCLVILDLSVDIEMLITTGIVDLDIDCLALDILCAFVYIENCRLVII